MGLGNIQCRFHYNNNTVEEKKGRLYVEGEKCSKEKEKSSSLETKNQRNFWINFWPKNWDFKIISQKDFKVKIHIFA